MKLRLLAPCLLAAGATLACANRTPTSVADQPSAALSSPLAPGEAIPSGERIVGKTALEAVYDAENAGSIGYVSTPINAKMRADSASWAPFYVVVYPTSAASSVGTLLCAHTPADNCPDHGPDVAGAAQQVEPDVYGGGVLGHDHVMDYPGGDDFNVAWEPIIVLFTNSTAANSEHLVTDAQIADAYANGDVTEIPAPNLTFHCAAVAKAVWKRGTPVPPVS
jgi:hypothetical protein